MKRTIEFLRHLPGGTRGVRLLRDARCFLRLLILMLVGLFAISGTQIGEPLVNKEQQIKAAFLYNFTKFTEWPPPAFPDETSPIKIGVLGEQAFCDALENLVKDRKVNGRRIEVRKLETAQEASSSHVVFIAASEEKRAPAMLKSLKGRGVLTVGESEQFMAEGGMINFRMENDKVRFEINMDAAVESGLKISAQLQKLAVVVQRRK